ncbi:MAG: hypothetical protein KJN93_06680 [Alphaproteobacteria bacterium]|nr:hypothetical protein [Alphaproteobacteria bacterium]
MAHVTERAVATGHPIQRLYENLTRRSEERARRARMRAMLELDDHMLDDSGVTRGEVQHASSMPLSHNAATELRRISLLRRRRRF